MSILSTKPSQTLTSSSWWVEVLECRRVQRFQILYEKTDNIWEIACYLGREAFLFPLLWRLKHCRRIESVHTGFVREPSNTGSPQDSRKLSHTYQKLMSKSESLWTLRVGHGLTGKQEEGSNADTKHVMYHCSGWFRLTVCSGHTGIIEQTKW